MRAGLLIFLFLMGTELAHAEFGLHLGGHFGYGDMGGDAKDAYESRAIGTFGFQALPGLRMDSLLLGPLMDIRFIGQLGDSPPTFDGTPIVDFGGRSLCSGSGRSIMLRL